MSARPVIGVVGHEYVVPRFFGELPVAGTPTAYVARLVEAGARPVILPSTAAADLVDRVDGLVLTGGGDVDPARYGGSGPAADVVPRRDEAELALVRAAQEARVPLLGVCRGLQVLTVAFGGTLVGGLDHVHPTTGHPVRTASGSLVRDLLGPVATTTALHRQAAGDPGPSWRATAWTGDGTVEAIEWAGPGAWEVLGVQWHPELVVRAGFTDATGSAVFGWVREAAVRRTRRFRSRSVRDA